MSRWTDLWHPSDRRLRAWLESDAPVGVNQHVERCERCADRLVDLDLELDSLESETSWVRQALTGFLVPPDDLLQRVLDGVESRSRRDADLQLLAGLFSIGVETAQLVLAPDEDPDQRDHQALGDHDVDGTPPPNQEDDST